jgi:hypothetical protein
VLVGKGGNERKQDTHEMICSELGSRCYSDFEGKPCFGRLEQLDIRFHGLHVHPHLGITKIEQALLFPF